MSPGEIAREAMHHLIAGKAHLACAAQDLRAIGNDVAAGFICSLLASAESTTDIGVAYASKIVSRTAEELPAADAPVIPSQPDEHGT